MKSAELFCVWLAPCLWTEGDMVSRLDVVTAQKDLYSLPLEKVSGSMPVRFIDSRHHHVLFAREVLSAVVCFNSQWAVPCLWIALACLEGWNCRISLFLPLFESVCLAHTRDTCVSLHYVYMIIYTNLWDWSIRACKTRAAVISSMC